MVLPFDNCWHVTDTVARASKFLIHFLRTVNTSKRENSGVSSCLLYKGRILSGMREILPGCEFPTDDRGIVKFFAESKESLVGGRVFDSYEMAI
jgi:hypothetical protein